MNRFFTVLALATSFLYMMSCDHTPNIGCVPDQVTIEKRLDSLQRLVDLNNFVIDGDELFPIRYSNTLHEKFLREMEISLCKEKEYLIFKGKFGGDVGLEGQGYITPVYEENVDYFPFFPHISAPIVYTYHKDEINDSAKKVISGLLKEARKEMEYARDNGSIEDFEPDSLRYYQPFYFKFRYNDNFNPDSTNHQNSINYTRIYDYGQYSGRIFYYEIKLLDLMPID